MKPLVIAIVVVAALGVLPTHAEADGIPVHGNWCGPDHGSGGEAVDGLDRACMRHDKCYETQGYGDCGCDAQLVSDIDALPGGGPPKATAIRSWFATVQPCHTEGFLVPAALNTLVRKGKPLTDDKLDKKDLKAVVDVATSTPGGAVIKKYTPIGRLLSLF